MGRKIDKSLIRESLEELKQILEREKDIRVKRRIKVIYLLKSLPNVRLKEVAQIIGVSLETVKKYWRLYKIGGIGNLKLKHRGRIPILTKRELGKLKERAKEGFESLKEIQEWIEEEFEKKISIKSVSRICKKLGIKKQKGIFQYSKKGN